MLFSQGGTCLSEKTGRTIQEITSAGRKPVDIGSVPDFVQDALITGRSSGPHQISTWKGQQRHQVTVTRNDDAGIVVEHFDITRRTPDDREGTLLATYQYPVC